MLTCIQNNLKQIMMIKENKEIDPKVLEKKKVRLQEKKQSKKKLSDALRKNLLRRKSSQS